MLVRSRRWAWIASALVLLLACGDSTSSGGGQGGGENTGAGNAGGENTGAGNTGGENTGAGNTGGAPDGGANEGGSGGEGPVLVNGCSLATADDMTGMASVDLTWSLPHQRCVIVDALTTVTWTGDFGFHPLAGGVTATIDAASPITQSDQSGASADVTFDEVGDFPYFCEIHTSSMQGVIYVVAP